MLFGFRVEDQVTPDNHYLSWIFSDFIFEQGLLDIPLVGGNLVKQL
jgi:hypothetical protein